MSSESAPRPDPRDRDGNQDPPPSDDRDRPGHVTARAAGVLIGLALGLLLIAWVLYGLIDMQRG